MAIKYIVPMRFTYSPANPQVLNASFDPVTTYWSSNGNYSIGDTVRYINYVDGEARFQRTYTCIKPENGTVPPSGHVLSSRYWQVSDAYAQGRFLDHDMPTAYGETDESYVDIVITREDTPITAIAIFGVNCGSYAIYPDSGPPNAAITGGGTLIDGIAIHEVPDIAVGSVYVLRLAIGSLPSIKITNIVAGEMKTLTGDVQKGLTLDYESYSTNDNTQFGATRLVKRQGVTVVRATLEIPKASFNAYHKAFVDRDAENTVWILTEDPDYETTITFGTASLSLQIPYATKSIAEVQIRSSI